MAIRLQAILFDTRSIQKYIFASNRLKTNIGASFLVESAFSRELMHVLHGIFGEGEVDGTTWREVESPDWTQMEKKCRIGYIGGGNALVLFREETADEELVGVIRAFTKRLLWKSPGLRTGAARGELVLEADGSYRVTRVKLADGREEEIDDLTHLVRKLKAQQNLFFPNVSPTTWTTFARKAASSLGK